MKRSSLLTCVVLTLAASTLPAQIKKVIPPSLTKLDGNTSSAYPFGYTTTRTQQIFLGSSVCTTTAILNGLAFRMNGGGTDPGRQAKSLKLSLGYTSFSPLTMSSNFATNRTGAQTLLFSGNYNLPPQISTPNPAPFNIIWTWTKPFIYQNFQGNLLMEIEVPGTVGKSSYFVDCHRFTIGASGTTKTFGSGGLFSAKDIYKFSCAYPGDLHPGGKFSLTVDGLKSAYPNIAIFGRSNTAAGPLPLPFNLGPLGAPGNSLYTELFIMTPITLTPTGGIYSGTTSLTIPADTLFVNLILYGQGIFVDPAANNLGLVATPGVTMQVGDLPPAYNLCGHYDSTRTTGNINKTPYGIVTEFTGIIN